MLTGVLAASNYTNIVFANESVTSDSSTEVSVTESVTLDQATSDSSQEQAPDVSIINESEPASTNPVVTDNTVPSDSNNKLDSNGDTNNVKNETEKSNEDTQKTDSSKDKQESELDNESSDDKVTENDGEKKDKTKDVLSDDENTVEKSDEDLEEKKDDELDDDNKKDNDEESEDSDDELNDESQKETTFDDLEKEKEAIYEKYGIPIDISMEAPENPQEGDVYGEIILNEDGTKTFIIYKFVIDEETGELVMVIDKEIENFIDELDEKEEDEEETEEDDEKETYTVSFIDSITSEVFASYSVKEGESVDEAPEAPIHENYKFKRYEGNYSNIQQDETVIAIYEENDTSVASSVSVMINEYQTLVIPFEGKELIIEDTVNTLPVNSTSITSCLRLKTSEFIEASKHLNEEDESYSYYTSNFDYTVMNDLQGIDEVYNAIAALGDEIPSDLSITIYEKDGIIDDFTIEANDSYVSKDNDETIIITKDKSDENEDELEDELEEETDDEESKDSDENQDKTDIIAKEDEILPENVVIDEDGENTDSGPVDDTTIDTSNDTSVDTNNTETSDVVPESSTNSEVETTTETVITEPVMTESNNTVSNETITNE